MHYFIINPRSSSGNGGKIWKELEPVIQASDIRYQVLKTEYPGHAIKLAAEIPEENTDDSRIISVMGGDGSLNEVLNGSHLTENTIIGYIPSGSGNDFARGMHLPVVPDQALRHILNPKDVHTLDYGVVKYGEENRTRRFLVSSGIGYDAAVCYRIESSKIKKLFNMIHLGKLAYFVLGVEQVFKCKMVSGTLTIDDKKTISLDNLAFMSCHNLPYQGGGWKFAPEAQPDDGFLDLCVVTAKNRWDFLLTLVCCLLGARHVKRKRVHMIRCRKASLHLNQKLPTHTDGEVIGYYKDLEYQCHPDGLRAVW